MKLDMGLEKLTAYASELIERCKKNAYDGTVLFTPDGVGNYDALWTRDFGYMVRYCGDLMKRGEIRGCIEYIIRGARHDGWMPDRVEAGGDAVYAAGSKGAPVGKANLDNTIFLIFAVDAYLHYVSSRDAAVCFTAWAEALDKGLDILPLSEEGLIWNDPNHPHSPYGFTDTVRKTGRLFKESILFWEACKLLSNLHSTYGSVTRAQVLTERASRVEKALPLLWDSASTTFFAADGDCRQTDIWGMLYGLDVGFPFPGAIQESMEKWLLENKSRYLYNGQVCQLPDGKPWEKLLIEVPAGEYQNGAYWGTASGWALRFFRKKDPVFFEEMLEELLRDFEEDGICECINEGYRKLPQFVVSATNARGGLL